MSRSARVNGRCKVHVYQRIELPPLQLDVVIDHMLLHVSPVCKLWWRRLEDAPNTVCTPTRKGVIRLASKEVADLDEGYTVSE